MNFVKKTTSYQRKRGTQREIKSTSKVTSNATEKKRKHREEKRNTHQRWTTINETSPAVAVPPKTNTIAMQNQMRRGGGGGGLCGTEFFFRPAVREENSRKSNPRRGETEQRRDEKRNSRAVCVRACARARRNGRHLGFSWAADDQRTINTSRESRLSRDGAPGRRVEKHAAEDKRNAEGTRGRERRAGGRGNGTIPSRIIYVGETRRSARGDSLLPVSTPGSIIFSFRRTLGRWTAAKTIPGEARGNPPRGG